MDANAMDADTINIDVEVDMLTLAKLEKRGNLEKIVELAIEKNLPKGFVKPIFAPKGFVKPA